MKDREIGTRFITKRGVVLEVVHTEEDNCNSCYYLDKPKCNVQKCLADQRKDNKEVHFLNVTDTLTEAQKIQLGRGLLANCDVQK